MKPTHAVLSLAAVALFGFAFGAGTEAVQVFTKTLRAPGFQVWDAASKRVVVDVGPAIFDIEARLSALESAGTAATSGAPVATVAAEVKSLVQDYNALGQQIADLQKNPSLLDRDTRDTPEVKVAVADLKAQQAKDLNKITSLLAQLPARYEPARQIVAQHQKSLREVAANGSDMLRVITAKGRTPDMSAMLREVGLEQEP